MSLNDFTPQMDAMGGRLSELSAKELRVVRITTDGFGIQAHSIERLSGGFSGSSVFRVATTGGSAFVIRLAPLEKSLPSERLTLLQQLLQRVGQSGQHGIPIPLSPLKTLIGSSSELRHMGDGWCIIEDWRVTAEPWIVGQPVAAKPSKEQLRSAIRYLSAFHERMRDAAAELPPNEWFFRRIDISPGLIRRFQIVVDLTQGGLDHLSAACLKDADRGFRSLGSDSCSIVRRWLPWLTSRLSVLRSVTFRLQPVVRDLWRPHVLFSGDDVSGIIDLSSAASDHLVTDFARLFRSWFESDYVAMNTACNEVSQRYSLTSMERQLLQCLDACSTLLSPITWVRRRAGSSPQNELTPEIRSRLEHLLAVASQFQPIEIA